jgi:ribosomal protein S18 acetylase RimI-like enzyme
MDVIASDCITPTESIPIQMTEDATEQFDIEQVVVELATDDDIPSIIELFREGLDEGHIRANDTGADIENLREAYFNDEGQSGFWVARYHGQVIGMIGVQKTSENAAEVRRLRVRENFRRHGVGTKLMETALTFCHDHSYLKVILDVRIERGPAIALFEKFGFTLARTRELDGRKMLDFYVDLYREQNHNS